MTEIERVIETIIRESIDSLGSRLVITSVSAWKIENLDGLNIYYSDSYLCSIFFNDNDTNIILQPFSGFDIYFDIADPSSIDKLKTCLKDLLNKKKILERNLEFGNDH